MKFLVAALLLFAAPLRAEIADTSAQFVGAEYLIDPLGEGVGYDSDPLVRFDAFDCLTFVETVLALENGVNLNDIRYKDGRVDFVARHHFLAADWVPNNRRIVRDATRTLGLPFTLQYTTIDRAAWFRKVHGISVDASPVVVESVFIPKVDIKAYRGRIVSLVWRPMVVAFVTSDMDLREKVGTDLVYSHIGFLIPAKGTLLLRHASSTAKKVVDVDFFKYVEGRTSIKGVSILEPISGQ
ncbi:MAG: DUF1460 domain-containing protein [Rickettsiales bacterium]|jgi:hypothetical protein|nr:DUF1460 domain-containing protein [Rickettsiales bacterium]